MKPINRVATLASVFGAMGIGAVALLGSPQSAEAATICGPGAGWVNGCPAGVDRFPKSWIVIDLWLLNSDGSMGQNFDNVMLSGPAKVRREEGDAGVINNKISVNVSADVLGLGPISIAGKGTGQIQDIDGDGLASSFFDVFAEVNTPFGLLHNEEAFHLEGDRPLRGVPPTVVPPAPVVGNPCHLPDPNAPDVVIAYCGFDRIVLVDRNGIPRAIVYSETHIIHPNDDMPTVVPEPSSAIPIALVGLAGMWTLRKRQQLKKG